MMELETVIAAMTPDIYQRLMTAVETGKWADGVALTPEQKENSLQLVMLWQSRHNEVPQHMSIAKGGEIVTRLKQQLQEDLNSNSDNVTYMDLS